MFQTHIFIITRASFNFLRTSFGGLTLSHDFILFLLGLKGRILVLMGYFLPVSITFYFLIKLI